MKYSRQMLAGCFILVSVFSYIALSGCELGHYRGRDRGYDREDRHYYRDGRWYRHDARGNEIVVDVLANGAFIESLPPQHTIVVIQGTSYYHDDRYYYRQAPNGGYAVVAPPVIVQSQPQNNHGKREERGSNPHNENSRN
jgi:hypothetical protein